MIQTGLTWAGLVLRLDQRPYAVTSSQVNGPGRHSLNMVVGGI
jgi:hypothetical protein